MNQWNAVVSIYAMSVVHKRIVATVEYVWIAALSVMKFMIISARKMMNGSQVCCINVIVIADTFPRVICEIE